MIYQFLVVLVTVLILSVSAQLYPEDNDGKRKAWWDYKYKYKKSYRNMDEETKRYNIFLQNLKVADERNSIELQNGGSAVYGVTRLLDQTQGEFKHQYLSKKVDYNSNRTESEMAAYVQSTGPLTVCVDATTWNSYIGDVLTVCGNTLNHCLDAVSVDTVNGYWVLRNNWGADWGEAGDIKISYGHNTCSIAGNNTVAKH